MRKYAGALVFVFLSIAPVVVGQAPAPNPVPWAYGYLTPGPEPLPPPCPADAKPLTCSRPGRPWPEDGTLLRLPGTDRSFTITQVQAHYDPADWYPQDHPATSPDIVQHGTKATACAHAPTATTTTGRASRRTATSPLFQ